MPERNIRTHTGEPLNWCGIAFILFWTIGGAFLATTVTESFWCILAIIMACEYASALIAGWATKHIRFCLNDIRESCYGQ